ncbi:MAG: SIMPL domain-containing protein [Cyanobacteria bacterium P01_D01_bin.105]
MKRYAFALAAWILLPTIGFIATPRAASAQPIEQTETKQAEPMRSLTVTGRGTEMIATTLTQVSLGVLVEAKTAENAQQAAATRSAAVIDWLQSQNVDKLATAGISLSPRYENRNDRRVLSGYVATNTLTFRVPTEAAGTIIDQAVRVGATKINGVSFVADDDAITAARQRALESATQDARQQANTVLSALDLSLEEVINITIGAVSAPPPNVALRAVAEADFAATTPVIGQEQTISAQVTLRIRY